MTSKEDDDITRLAIRELTEDAERGKTRSKEIGALAWRRRQMSTADKRYLTNTIIGSVQSNKRKAEVQGSKVSKNSSIKNVDPHDCGKVRKRDETLSREKVKEFTGSSSKSTKYRKSEIEKRKEIQSFDSNTRETNQVKTNEPLTHMKHVSSICHLQN